MILSGSTYFPSQVRFTCVLLYMMGSAVTLEAMKSGTDGVVSHETTGEIKQHFQAREGSSQT